MGALGLGQEFVLAYAIALFFLVLASLGALGIRVRPLWWLPFIPVFAGLFDLAEDLALLSVSTNPAQPNPMLVAVACAAAAIEFLLLLVTVLALLGVFGLLLMSRPWIPRRHAPPYLKSIERVLRNETRYLRSRRRRAGLDSPEALMRRPMGLSLSGGGIRSAMLGLGLLQSLQRAGVVRHVDYLSTVSGGGYIGTALSSLLSIGPGSGRANPTHYRLAPGERPRFAPDGPEAPFATAGRRTASPECPWLDGDMVVAHLRAFGDYLIRRRRLLDRDLLRAVGSISSGIVASLVIFVMLALVVSGALLTVIYVVQPLAFRDVDPGLCAYLKDLWSATGGVQFALVATVGGATLLTTAIILSLIQVQCPPRWSVRDGDTPEDAGQYRLLWVVGVMGLIAGLALGSGSTVAAFGGTPSLLNPIAFFLGAAVAAGVAHIAMVIGRGTRGWFRTSVKRRSFVGAVLALAYYALLLGAGLALLPWVLEAASGIAQTHPGGMAATSVTGGGALGVLAWWGAHRKDLEAQIKRGMSWLERTSDSLARLTLGLVASAFVVAALIVGFAVLLECLKAHEAQNASGAATVTLACGGVLFVLGLWIDFNRLSLHFFYRDRLTDAFLRTEARPAGAYGRELEVKRDQAEMALVDLHGEAVEYGRPSAAETFFVYRPHGSPRWRWPWTLSKRRGGWRWRWTGFRYLPLLGEWFRGAATAAPYHLYVTAINLATERDMRFRSRKSDLFIFSKLYCGSSVTGYIDTGVYRSGETKVARVMTISGAALDSAVGRATFFAQSFAATLFNIRLGQWMENPAYSNGRLSYRQESRVFWPLFMIMESLGMSDSHRRLVHLSDGGHSGDNLGLIPLLQRRCRLILALDAEQDPDMRCESLLHAIRYAEVDLDVRIEIPPDAFVPDASGRLPRHFVIAPIRYLPTDGHPQEELGLLVLLKSSLAETDPFALQKFRQSHPAFPQDSTNDQFFSEDDVEAYRKLGEIMGEELLEAHPELARGELESSSGWTIRLSVP